MTNKLKRQCLYLVTEDRHRAAIVEAWEWINTYCLHYATQGRDWQTTDNMSAASRVIAQRHMGTLRRLGMIMEDGFRGNFVKKPL